MSKKPPKNDDMFYGPSRINCCVRLVRGDHSAGVLLYRIIYHAKYGKALIPGAEGYWKAAQREYWMKEAYLSDRQLDRALAKLDKLGLIERRQWWFGRKNMLHVRPSQSTLDYCAAATTWDAADAFLPDEKIAKDGKPTSPKTESSNELAENGKPTLPETANSKDLEGLTFIKKESLTGATSASPSCATSPKGSGEVLFPENKKEEPPSPHSPPSPEENLSALAVLAWEQAVTEYHGAEHAPLTAKGKGAIAEVIRDLPTEVAQACIQTAIRNWPAFGKLVQSEYDGFSPPAKPCAVYFAKHSAVAIGIFLDKVAKENAVSTSDVMEHYGLSY